MIGKDPERQVCAARRDGVDRLRMIASIAAEWEAADEGHAEFIFTNLSGGVEAAYVHGVAVTRTETLKWLLTVPLGDPESDSPAMPTEEDIRAFE